MSKAIKVYQQLLVWGQLYTYKEVIVCMTSTLIITNSMYYYNVHHQFIVSPYTLVRAWVRMYSVAELLLDKWKTLPF